MKVFNLRIECDNAAFGELRDEAAWEVSSILSKFVDKLKHEVIDYSRRATFILRDHNGNSVGIAEFKFSG